MNLYDIDIAQDIKYEFENLIRQGNSCKNSTNIIISKYRDEIMDLEDGIIFWLALADIQWELGCLLPEIKKKAIEIIDSGIYLEIWQTQDPNLEEKWKQNLQNLKERLNSPYHTKKRKSKSKLYQCDWENGDVFAYRLENALAKEKNLYGRYVLIQKVGETAWHPGHIIPIVRVKITPNCELPVSEKTFDKLEYIRVFSEKYDIFCEEFTPTKEVFSEEEFLLEVEKIKTQLPFDEYNLLPIFQLKLIITSPKDVPLKFKFVGNFQHIQLPKIEFIPKNKINLPSVFLKKSEEMFETYLINCYYWHNLKQLEIYSSNA